MTSANSSKLSSEREVSFFASGDASVLQRTVFPRIVRAGSINFTALLLRGQFKGALYTRARFDRTSVLYIEAIVVH